MKRLLVGMVLSAICLTCSGCLAVATVAAVGAVAVSTYKPATKAPKPTGETVSQPAPAPVAPVAPPPPVVRAATDGELTAQAAASLTREGSVVVVDAVNGTRATLAWHDGMKLAEAAGKSGDHHTARIFRGSRELPADLRQDWTAGLALLSGDVIELRR